MVDKLVLAGEVAVFGEYRDEALRIQEQQEALRLARTIALACMPKRRSKDRDLIRSIRLGAASWVKVTYSASADTELPYGDDRFVLAGIIHLALQNRSPLVDFGTAGALLKMFEIDRGKRAYVLLRQRLRRLRGLSITIKFAASREDLENNDAEECVENQNLIRRAWLPTGHVSQQERNDTQLALFCDSDLDEWDIPRYGVLLSQDVWNFIKDPKQQFLVPIHLLKHFVNNPTGWDYLMFLVHRCGAAQSVSKVPHEALMHLFKDSEDEPDRKVINRLKGVHAQVMALTEGKLCASLEEDGLFPQEGRGRPSKRWCLKVGPSESLLPNRWLRTKGQGG